MNKKYLICLFIILILVCGFIGFSYFQKNLSDNTNNNLPGLSENNGEIIENVKNQSGEEQPSKYIMEEKAESYEAMLEEAESKDFITLFIQTNIFENTKKIKVNYNSKKLLLNTANPFLENVEISKAGEDGFKSFEIDINPLENYNMIFIKKAKDSKIEKEDVILKEI